MNQDLLARIEKLEELIGVKTSFEEAIRSTVFFDTDTVSSTTVHAVNTSDVEITVGGLKVKIPPYPTKFARVYVDGKVYNIGLIAIT